MLHKECIQLSCTNLHVHNCTSKQRYRQKDWTRNFEHFNFAMMVQIAGQNNGKARTHYWNCQQWYSECPIVCGQTRGRTRTSRTSFGASIAAKHFSIISTNIVTIFFISHFHNSSVEAITVPRRVKTRPANALVCASYPCRISSKWWPIFTLN